MNAKQQATLEKFAAYYRNERRGNVSVESYKNAHGEIVVCIKQGDVYRPFSIGSRGGVFYRPENSNRRGVYTATGPHQVPVETKLPADFAK